MAQSSGGGGGFLWFLIGIGVGVAGTIYGPGLYQQYANRPAGEVRMEIEPQYTPGVWTRRVRFDIEYSAKKENGQNWDWPMTAPELQLCVREGSEYRKCYGPLDPEVGPCQGKYRCTTGVIPVPAVAFAIELNEWDDYNKPDPIGSVDCDVGQTCKFPLGVVVVRDAGTAAPQS